MVLIDSDCKFGWLGLFGARRRRFVGLNTFGKLCHAGERKQAVGYEQRLGETGHGQTLRTVARPWHKFPIIRIRRVGQYLRFTDDDTVARCRPLFVDVMIRIRRAALDGEDNLGPLPSSSITAAHVLKSYFRRRLTRYHALVDSSLDFIRLPFT